MLARSAISPVSTNFCASRESTSTASIATDTWPKLSRPSASMWRRTRSFSFVGSSALIMPSTITRMRLPTSTMIAMSRWTSVGWNQVIFINRPNR